MASGLLSILAACSGGPSSPPPTLLFVIGCDGCDADSSVVRIPVGETVPFFLLATLIEDDGVVPCPEVTWTSSAPSIARVTGEGKTGTATGVAPGTATMTVDAVCGSFGRRTTSAQLRVQ